jgi:glycine/D-amino acid oxidase-like deaminating enzyme
MGAGITGSCLALALEAEGREVTLVDSAPEPLMGASLHNEGKLHLGFVYANDPLHKTHDVMLEGSLAFSDIIRDLTGATADDLEVSTPFFYVVPHDSQVGVDGIRRHFEDVSASAALMTETTGQSYLGTDIDVWFRQNSDAEHEKLFSTDTTLASFVTAERAVRTDRVADVLRRRITSSGIAWLPHTEVVSVDRRGEGPIQVMLREPGSEARRASYDVVVNCLWHDRLRIDESAGIVADGSWLFRYKASLTLSGRSGDPRPVVPSVTMVLGAYGDVVNYDNQRFYLSWYPECRLGETREVDCRWLYKVAADADDHQLAASTVAELSRYVPAVQGLHARGFDVQVGGGVIYAAGSTDISDPSSLLHQRSTIGPRQYGSYLSIDTGKYCTGPLFAMQAARMVEDLLA